jgi:diguanylate cyclase (GGDEF)-like protein
MPEPTRQETQLGLAELKRRFNAAGLPIIEHRRNTPLQRSTYFVIGTPERQTDITVVDTFLDDLPATKDYHTKVDSYAAAVAGRIKCGFPEVFYCRSRVAIRVSISWPIQSGMTNSGTVSTFVLIDAINQESGRVAKCAAEIGFSSRTVFDILPHTINRLRFAVDYGLINFFEPEVRQETYQRIKHQQQIETRTQAEIEQFFAGKAYLLGFLTVDEPSDIWGADPWDAQYLGVTRKELLLAMRIMQANGMLLAGIGPEYARPTDKLLAQQAGRNQDAEEIFHPQHEITRMNLSNKEALLSDLQTVLTRHSISAVLVIDLDQFKLVNDTKGHSEGDACLDRVVSTIASVIGRKGKLYRWGGDEFSILLPDFSTEEAQVTAERIRSSVEQARLGGEIAVTTSIGICGTDRTESKSSEEILNLADKAMYKSKRAGKNRTTIWPFRANT